MSDIYHQLFAKQSVYRIPSLNLLLALLGVLTPQRGHYWLPPAPPAPPPVGWAAHCLANRILETSQSCSLHVV